MASFKSVDELNAHLKTRSYVTGYALSADDKACFAALSGVPNAASHPFAYRWALHVAALCGTRYAQGIRVGKNSSAHHTLLPISYKCYHSRILTFSLTKHLSICLHKRNELCTHIHAIFPVTSSILSINLFFQ
jgi:hypothetical protein